MAESRAVLYAFWLSSCSWRVRAALHWKGIPYEERAVDIVREKYQFTEEFRAINPAQKVPALVIDGVTIMESMAILQYLEDTRPEPTLTPRTAIQKAQMREICETVVSGIQPLQNIGLKSHFDTEDKFQKFARYWTDRGLQTLEELLKKNSSSRFCVGEQLSMADLCLVPQIYNATIRLKLDISKYPTVSKIYTSLLQEKVLQETHPKNIKRLSKM